jgi:glc operon protein GlcG
MRTTSRRTRRRSPSLPAPGRLAAHATAAALLAAVGLAATAARAADESAKAGLTLAAAKTVAAAGAAEARKNGAGGAIAVVDDGGHLLYLERLDGTFPAAAAVSIAKARTAAIFRRATADFENAINKGRTALVANTEMMPLQGGVPLVAGGEVVGAVGVSGAMSAAQDEEIARAAAGALP